MCLGAEVVVIAIDPATARARVDDGNSERTVSLVLRPQTRVGDRVIVHTGFVVSAAEGTPATPPSG
jgi:hydrogenase maturation factor